MIYYIISLIHVCREAMVFLADGRFHLESAMIANPDVKAYRYNPYDKSLTLEGYEVEKMKMMRFDAISTAKATGHKFGIILGTLGRQGNVSLLQRVRSLLTKHGKEYFVLLLSEIFPKKLELFKVRPLKRGVLSKRYNMCIVVILWSSSILAHHF